MLLSVAPGSPPDDPVRGLGPCSTQPRMLQSGAFFCRILSVASDAPVRGSGFSPGRSSAGARAELHSAPDVPIRGVMFLTLFAVCAGVCVSGALVLFFFRAPFVVAPPPLPPTPLSLAPCPVPRFVVCCARFPGSRHPVAVVAWHLSSCRGCGRRRASLACLVAPRWCAAPRPVRSLSVLRSAFPSPWCLPPPQGLSPPALLGGCAGHVEAGREPGSCACPWPLPRQGRWARSTSYPFGAPRWGCPWRVPPASVLGCVRCGGLACVDPVTDASGIPYRLSCDGGLGWCTGAVSCGRRHRPFRVGGRHAKVPRVCACACPAWPGRAGRPPGRVLVRLTFPLAVLRSLFAFSAPSGLGLPCLWLSLVFFFVFLFPFPPLVAPSLWLALRVFPPRMPWALASCPPPFFFARPPCCLWCFLLSGCPGPLRPPPFFFLYFLFFLLPLFFFAGCAVRGGFLCLWPSDVPACASVVLSLLLLTVRWLVLRGVRCWAWLSSAVSWWVLVSCFGGAVLVWPRGSPPCCSAWCVLMFRCPVLCCVALCCRVVVCCRALPFVCVVACALCLFLAAARLLCVFWGVVLCVPCPLRPVRCCAAPCWYPFVVLCASSVLFLVAGVVGSWCRCLFMGVCWWLWLPGVVVCWCVSAWVPVSGLAVARRLPCGVLLPCAVSCGALLPCGEVLWCPVSFFFFLLAGGAGFLLFFVGSGLRAGSGSFLFLCSARAVLCWCACVLALCSVLSCPRGAGWCFVLLPVVFVCLLLGLAALCCLLVGPGGSWCLVSVACCGVSLGAVLRRVAARCVAWRCVVVRCVVSFCSVWCCRALCCVLGRCPLSWNPVASGVVFCLVPSRCVCFAVARRCVALFAVVLCAMCALGCRVARFLSSPPCAVLLCGQLSLGALIPCTVPRGAVLPRAAVVSCPADLLGLFLAWLWLYLLEKPLQIL